MNFLNVLAPRIRTHTVRYNDKTDLLIYAAAVVVIVVLFNLITKYKPNWNEKLVGTLIAIPVAIITFILVVN